MRATKKDIKVVYADWLDLDWGKVNRLISRGFTHLYQIGSDECPLGSKTGLVLARKGINQRRALQLYHGNGHGGVRCGS